jgi:hypothetical protein
MPRPHNPDMFDSMAQAAAALRISKDSLKRAKEMGAPGFYGSRVNGREFTEWWKKNGGQIQAAASSGSLRDQKLAEEVRKLRIANDQKESKLIDAAKNDQFLLAASKGFQAILWQKLLNELPASAANQDAPAIRILAENVYNRVMVEIKKFLKTPELRAILEKEQPTNEPG